MWPHSFVVGVGGISVCIGTDDPDLVASLAPWCIDEATDLAEPVDLYDYGIELHPAQPDARGVPRVMPNLRHGSDRLATVPDEGPLVDGLLRILGGLEAERVDGEFALSGVPLVCDDGVHLLTVEEMKHGSYRRFAADGAMPLLVDRVWVDPDALTVRVAAPLGSGRPAEVLPLRAWNIAPYGVGPDAPTAELVAAAASRVAVVPDTDPREPSAMLLGLARLVQHLRPGRGAV